MLRSSSMFVNGDFSQLVVWPGIRGLIPGLLVPDVPDSELQASVSHTLDVETGGWDGCCCCVQHHAVQVRGPSRIIKTRHYDLQLLLHACQAQQLCLRETPQLCLRSNGSGVLGERWLCSTIPAVLQGNQTTVGHSSTAGKGILALLRRDIRARLHHCWANSLVNVCDAVLKGVTDHSRGVLTEMRAARDLHTVSCTLQHSCARAGQEGAELANALTDVAMAVTCALSSAMKSHTSLLYGTLDPLPGQAKSCYEVHGVRVFLHCDIRASLSDCRA